MNDSEKKCFILRLEELYPDRLTAAQTGVWLSRMGKLTEGEALASLNCLYAGDYRTRPDDGPRPSLSAFLRIARENMERNRPAATAQQSTALDYPPPMPREEYLAEIRKIRASLSGPRGAMAEHNQGAQ